MTKLTLRALPVAVAAVLAAAPTPSSAWFGGSGDSGRLVKDADAFAADKPAELRPFYRRLFLDGEWGAVLNFNQLGLAAMERGERGLAKRAFDEAIARIDHIYANDENARRALSLFSEEKIKDFKGEPYERAMTFYYRGLLYLADGDYQNARAAFLAADLQDTLAEKETYAGDFGLMKYLAGWASLCDGDAARGRALIAEAKAVDASVAPLPDEPGPALVLVDSGGGPRKTSKGEHNELLAFQKGAGPDAGVTLRVSGGTTLEGLRDAADLYHQASTRGGRPVDTVLNGKARFKGDMDTAGEVATSVGLGLIGAGVGGDNSNLAGAGAIIGILGMIAKGVAAATTPAADTRQWSSLPAVVLVHIGEVPPGTVSVSTPGTQGERALALQSSGSRCSIAWGRTRSALPSTFGGEAAVDDRSELQEDGRKEKNARFREMLRSEFGPLPTRAASELPGAPGEQRARAE